MKFQKFTRKLLLLVLVVVSLSTLLVGSAFADDDGDDDGDDDNDGVVTVSLQDAPPPLLWSVIASSSAVEEKTVRFDITNNSSLGRPHELAVIKTDLPPGQLPLKANGIGVEESQVQIVSRSARLSPGAIATLSLNLKEGNYALICNIGNHYNQGMYRGFRVGEEEDDD